MGLSDVLCVLHPFPLIVRVHIQPIGRRRQRRDNSSSAFEQRCPSQGFEAPRIGLRDVSDSTTAADALAQPQHVSLHGSGAYI